MIDIKTIPDELLERRETIECSFVFSLYNDMSLLDDYNNVENGNDIITKDGMFYYGLLKGLKKAGYNTADSMSIYQYLEEHKKANSAFEERGGMATVKEISELLSPDNVEAYYNDLLKNNLLIRLDKAGFPVVNKLDKFTNMSYEEIYDYYEYQLSNISIGKIEKMDLVDLSDGDAYKKAIQEWNKGSDVGFRISSKMLNYQLLGVHRKNLMLHLSGIGFGKTTSAVAWYIIPALEDGNDVCIIANEQDKDSWMKMILSTVLFNKIGKVEGFSRHKLSTGDYTEVQIEKMEQAANWLDEQKGKITFAEMENYDINSVKRIITRQSKLGTSLFIFDTLKSIDDSAQNAWGQFSEVAKELFLLAKHLDVAIVATAQLAPDAMSRRFLDLTCIGRARSIAETANSVVMFRPLSKDEKEKVQPYKYEGKVKKLITLDKDKDYIMVFTPKNRYGQVSPQIIMERNLNFNTYQDVGWYECEYDQFRNR